MNSISHEVKNLLNIPIRLLNQPAVKEGIKNIAGSVTFIFGIIQTYDFYQIARGRKISTEDFSNSPQWIQTANKVIVLSAKISLILSATVSRPGKFIISSLIGYVFSTSQLDRAFGPNTILAVNPWHPRHIVSIAAVILAMPSVIQSTYKGVSWVSKNIRQHQKPINHNQVVHPWLTDAKVRMMVLFNIITSRPILHIGNQFARYILRSA